MGAWSHESFGNDDACDWGHELAETNDLSVIESALDSVLAIGDDYLDLSEASNGIAAAEVIAQLQGNRSDAESASYEPVDEWVARVKLTPPQPLARKAHQVLDRVLQEPSEALELWQEGKEGNRWVEAVRNLKTRIRI